MENKSTFCNFTELGKRFSFEEAKIEFIANYKAKIDEAEKRNRQYKVYERK